MTDAHLIPTSNLPRVVVIGGGFAGINFAKSLKDKPYQIVLLDKNNYHTFQPLLYQVATGGLEPDSIAFPLRKFFDTQDNIIFRHTEVQEILPQEKRIITSIGEIEYDFLVLATGSQTNFFGLDLAEKVMGMKNIPEALDLRSLILQNFEQANYETNPQVKSELLKFIVVGGGPTGVETAGALAELKRFVLPADYPELDMRQMEIHLIEASPRLLNGMSDKSSKNAFLSLEKMGVHIWLNTVVESYDGHTILTSKGDSFEAATVIWGAGVKGCAPAGLKNDAYTKGNRLVVNGYNQIVEYPDIFAIGDICCMTEDKHYPQGHPQVAQVAIQMGKNLAYNLQNKRKDAPMRVFSYYDKGSMATIGRNKAVADLSKTHFSGYIAWMMWMMIHLLFLIGFRNRLVVLFNWIWSYFTYDKGARVIIRPFHRKRTTAPTLSDTHP